MFLLVPIRICTVRLLFVPFTQTGSGESVFLTAYFVYVFTTLDNPCVEAL